MAVFHLVAPAGGTYKLIVTRLADQYEMNWTSGAFAAAPASNRLSSTTYTQDGTYTGKYTFTVASTPEANWPDGDYLGTVVNASTSQAQANFEFSMSGGAVAVSSNAAPTAAAIAAAVNDSVLDEVNGIETNLTLRQKLRADHAFALGKVTVTVIDSDTKEVAFLRPDGSVAWTMTVNSDGSRTGSSRGNLG